ncbi:MAG: S-layer protein, partial [Candidatus Anstonellaceae archaeon]
MKGVNASKIAAIAASAMLLASGVVSAGLMYENIELVNPNGQPTAKVVVGSQAQISDGIAAANIAAVLANKAYKSSTLTATVVGSATCSAEGTTAGGSGTCEVLSKKALIEIIVPGQLANAYQFKTLITDTIDRTLQNRVSTNSEDKYNNSIDSNDVNTVLSPLRGSSVSTSKQELLYRISGDQFTPFKTKSVRDVQAPAEFTYEVIQSFWVGSTDGQVYYDSSAKEIVARPAVVAYSVFFGGNDYGIPVCTKASESGNGSWAWCGSSDQYATANHRLKIPFLGSEWIISSMSKPSGALTSSTAAIRGGTIKLAKEANYDIINIG